MIMTTSPSLKTNIQEAIKNAMRAKNTLELGTLRLAMAAIKQQEVDNRIELGDEAIVSLIGKMIKQRQESIKQYTQGNRLDLAANEEAELSILKTYLPQALSDTEIDHEINLAFTEINPQSPQDMGKIMAILKNKLNGRADMTDVSKRVKTRFA